jgi:thymidylate synthase (FAD)
VNLKIYLFVRPQFDVEAFWNFLNDENTNWKRTANVTCSEEIVEVSGRVCYMSFGSNQSPKDNREYINNLICMGHESVLEHISWTFLITGISRALTHQLVRHRAGFSFSQLSQQYHDESNAEFLEPTVLDQIPEAKKAWEHAVTAARASYTTILESLHRDQSIGALGLNSKEMNRAIRSAARSVLPNATATKIVVTANARALRYFLRVRGSIPGDVEMRQLSAGLLELLRIEAPSIFEGFEICTMQDGSPLVKYNGTNIT